MNFLLQYGWQDHFAEIFTGYAANGYSPGRVIVQNKTNYIVITKFGEMTAELTGKFYFDHDLKSEYPVVGDWVVLRILNDEKKAFIDSILPRGTKISRNAAGFKTDEQIIASNVDAAFIMTSMNHDINVRRLERYLVVCHESGIKPVIILSKADLCNNSFPFNKPKVPQQAGEEIKGDSLTLFLDNPSVSVHVISALKNFGLRELIQYFHPNKTVALLGSSGVGKTTLINALCPGSNLEVNDVSTYKDKGRHTTTKREMFLVPGGGMIIDNPGLRELQLWEGTQGLNNIFSDIEEYSNQCRFSDCSHTSEPGCAVMKAIETGTIEKERYKSYLKLLREVDYMERKQNIKAILLEKKRWKKLTIEGRKRSRL